jgi:hypothetical protein
MKNDTVGSFPYCTGVKKTILLARTPIDENCIFFILALYLKRREYLYSWEGYYVPEIFLRKSNE